MKKIFFLLFFIVLLTNLAFGSFSSSNQKGNKEYKKRNFDQALKYYQDAEIEKPDSPELSYNLGNVLYQQQKYEEAMQKYQKALELEKILERANTYYNLGNTFYRAGDFQGAIESYQKCLELNPKDEDAKYNLEFVRKKMKEMLDQQKKREEEQKNQKQQQNQSPQEKKQQQEQQKQSEQQKSQEQQQEQKEPEQMQPQEDSGMTKEDAERILNAIKDDEKKLQEKMRKLQIPAGRVRKDW